MRLLSYSLIPALALIAGCGQKGALVLPDARPASGVVIRGPGTAATPTTVQGPASVTQTPDDAPSTPKP
jgi:predicted small lipoprotein YifL